jgi:3-phosphoshikimate 1-carboxyvinyltransferase
MERVAEPLRLMGAEVTTSDGRAPMLVRGGVLRGVRYAIPIPTAQVKSAIVFAALTAEGETVVEEPAPTRDHTERALAALGAPVVAEPGRVRVHAFQHAAFDASVPGDVSSAAFLVVAAALTGSDVTITGVGLNPSRTAFLRVLARMGVETEPTVTGTELGEPVGEVRVLPATRLSGTTVSSDELPLVVDEVPVLSALATHAHGETWFLGAAELRVKESDRLAGVAAGVRALGGHAGDEAGDLVVAGTGLRGGVAQAGGDHRMAMALTVAALAADAPCDVEGIEAADVSFPGFPQTLAELGARVALQ